MSQVKTETAHRIQLRALEEAAGFLSDAAFNIRGHWTGPGIPRNGILEHIEAAERMIEIEIRRIS